MELVGIKSQEHYTMPGSWWVTLHIVVSTNNQTDALVAIADIVGQALEDAR